MAQASETGKHAGLNAVIDRINEAEDKAGRERGSVNLVAVGKTFGADVIRPVLDAGHRIFGENRVQESLAKWPELKAEYDGIDLHLIGPLQTNKVKDAIGLFDCIETLDRPKLARVLADSFSATGRTLRLFVQVNTGEEDQKAGILPEDADSFIADCRNTYGLTIDGLMCIPPVDEEPALHFALLGQIAERNGVTELSMGMSADFESAIALGATYVRVGSAIFGERAKPA